MDYLMALGKQNAPSISITRIPIYFNISPERSVIAGDLKEYIVFLLQRVNMKPYSLLYAMYKTCCHTNFELSAQLIALILPSLHQAIYGRPK